jgi:DNA-binding winged helix-turn-helix (wHTH) protein
VAYRFGRYQLDEGARVLQLDGEEVALQPRVFDLLVYLVQNQTRVVPKDELLDALWPGVTVTEASLQRAVSLARSALRAGGMDAAIRSFSRVGYRFCADDETGDPGAAATVHETQGNGTSSDVDAIAGAEQACAAQEWQNAVSLYAEAAASRQLHGADFDRWALAMECLGRPSDSISILTQAVNAHASAGNNLASARSALVLTRIHLQRGEAALCKGWLARAEQLIGESNDAPEYGLLLWLQARVAANEGEPAKALELASTAYDLGVRLGDPEVQSLGLMYRGFYKLSLGRTQEGLEDQDHAAALALSSQIDPITGNTIYCNILWACRTFGDWSRANQWTTEYQRWCSDTHMGYSGACQLHRAEVLGIQGTLQDALDHVNDALDQLPADAPWALGDAHRVLGDVHAVIGNDDAAFEHYEKAYALGWDAEPGHAMLLLERGEADAAYASLERSLVGNGWWTLQRQGILLAHLALIAAAAGKVARAQALIDDLCGQSDRWPMPSIRALTSEAAAVLALGDGDREEAIRHLYLARQLWTSIDSRFHAARLRIRIADLLLESGDKSGASTELRAACAAVSQLGSRKLEGQCNILQHRLG